MADIRRDRLKLFGWRVWLSLTSYLLPVALATLAFVTMELRREPLVASAIQGFRHGEAPAEVSDDLILARMTAWVGDARLHAEGWPALVPEQLRDLNTANFCYVLPAAWLPFLFLAGGLWRRGWSTLPEPIRAFKDGLKRVPSALLMVHGWMYLFHPFGLGSSKVYAWLKMVDIVHEDSGLLIFDIKHAEMRHVLVGFLGWYVHSLGMCIQRAAQGDVVGVSLERTLILRFLVVLGTSMTIGTLSLDFSVIVCFLIGVFPMGAVGALKELSLKAIDTQNSDVDTLSLIPDSSRAAITRLGEEGIESVSDMAHADLDKLHNDVTERVFPLAMLNQWQDISRLVCALGPTRWKEVRGDVQGAREFLARRAEPEFRAVLLGKGIRNVDELAEGLIERYPDLGSGAGLPIVR